MEKCISCEEKINTDQDYYNYTYNDEIICECCFDSDLNHAVVIFDNKNKKYYKGDYTFIDEYGDNFDIPSCIDNYKDLVGYKRSDGWRGYYEGKAPKGYKQVESRWFSGFDGYNMNDLMRNFHQIIEDDQDFISCFNYFYAVLPTSNVFSQNFELYIKESQFDEFVNAINKY